DGNEVFFRIKRSTQLKKLMNAYCDRQSVDMNAIAFLFDGRRLRGEQTPDEVRSLSSLHTQFSICGA
ncbi:Os01g0918300, partial [Oryza sativa Japonica Group]